MARKKRIKTASVKVRFPVHVPTEMRPVWAAAAQRLANKGKLIIKGRVASGKVVNAVDYSTVNSLYRRMLLACLESAEKAED